MSDADQDRPNAEDQAELSSDPEWTSGRIPFFGDQGLNIEVWPTWAIFPSRTDALPYFIAKIKTDREKQQITTFIDAGDILLLAGRMTHMLEATFQAARQFDLMKVDIFIDEERAIKELEDIKKNVELVIAEIQAGKLVVPEPDSNSD